MTHTVDRVAEPDARAHGVRRAPGVAVSGEPVTEPVMEPVIKPVTGEPDCAIVDATVPARGTE